MLSIEKEFEKLISSDVCTFKKLLENNPKTYITFEYSESLFERFIRTEHTKQDFYQKLDVLFETVYRVNRNIGDCSPLLIAIYHRNKNLVSYLLKKGANVNATHLYHASTLETCLHAIFDDNTNESIKIFKELVLHDVSFIEDRNGKSENILHWILNEKESKFKRRRKKAQTILLLLEELEPALSELQKRQWKAIKLQSIF